MVLSNLERVARKKAAHKSARQATKRAEKLASRELDDRFNAIILRLEALEAKQ
jgi:hypothetical protein